MKTIVQDEWAIIEALLPANWRQAAHEQKAFRRARYMKDPGELLRVLLFHAVNDGGLRETVAQARSSGIARMSQVALLKRLRTSGAWLTWLSGKLCEALRDHPCLPGRLRPRAFDSTTVQGPASKGTDWRVHYALDLTTLNCDWCEVTDAHGAELLERTPMQPGDVILADRNYLRPVGVRAARKAGAHVLLRLRWRHAAMRTKEGRVFRALQHAKRLKVGQVGQWSVKLQDPQGTAISGRVVITRLPALLAAKAERQALRKSVKKQKHVDPRSLQAAHYVMLFTTLPGRFLTAAALLNLYRFRWQIELAFKRLKQLLKIGHLPHKDVPSAKSWILVKLVIALLLDTLYRNARAISPWGYKNLAS